MHNGLEGKRALITGSTSRIGFHAAAMLADAGVAHVVLNGRNAERGEAARRAIGERAPNAKVSFVAADFSSTGGARAVIETGAKHLGGGFDILVNCAGGDHNPRVFRQ